MSILSGEDQHASATLVCGECHKPNLATACRLPATLYANSMRFLIIISLLFSSLAFAESDLQKEERLCSEFVKEGENYKVAHENQHCQNAILLGSAKALYSVGMGWGFAGDSEREELFYRLAADRYIIAAYLGLGHVLRDKNEDEAIYWYVRHSLTKTDAYEYSALLLAIIYDKRGNTKQAEYWLEVCRTSEAYKENCKL